MQEEPLDFCRVKKLDAKGFGFLKSLYYDKDIFFHFSQIKNELLAEKLEKMKRGDFFLYFTSKVTPDDRRKSDKIWYSLDEVPESYLNDFVTRILKEFEVGKTNIYDLVYLFTELKSNNFLTPEQIEFILNSGKIKSMPQTIWPVLNAEEKSSLKKILDYNKLKRQEVKPYWFKELH